MYKSFPRITLVTPSLNAEKTIERTLKSIEEQHYPNLQVICVDGLSTDSTVEIIERYRHVVNHLICEKDKNVADALNKAFKLAEGNIYCYLNADDALTSGALACIAQVFLDNPGIDVLTGGCRRVFADGSECITQPPENYLESLSMRNGIEQPSTFWRAGIHRRLGELDVSYQLAFDWEWWNRLYASGARFMAIPDILSVYYFSDDNLTSKAGLRVINEMYRITKTYGPFRGRIADIYRFLFKVFDLNGYYDQPFHKLPLIKRIGFGGTLWLLCKIFGKQTITSYNWNWASKQVRGLVWYK
ncbi:glycosyltransferase family 2 protein [Methylobacter sp. BBA5.1]|jgi:glycosyltransferase involved in cell wall biosynthesis|uniref:glycosyltransferase family 2 protein n=1 Tax=Methylobacter sp. BBA5.1 TaxID=1495064 RepID=UPI00068D7532|nr:glycosyltransferase family 2 protein [Methylobacter sp. BBA5.1]